MARGSVPSESVSSEVAAVAAAIAALDPDALVSAEDLTALFEARAALEAKALAAFGGYHAAGSCDVDGFRSPVGWLRAHVHVTHGEAKALAHRARTVQGWPTMQRLWVEGRLTGAQVATAVAMVPAGCRELFAEHDAELSPALVGCTLEQTREALTDWVARAEAVLSVDPTTIEDEAKVDGFFRLSRFGPHDAAAVAGELDSDTATVVEHALAAAERPDRDGEDRLASQRRVEALRRICEHYLSHRGCEGGAGIGAGITAVIDVPNLYRDALVGLGVHDADDLEALLEGRDVSRIEEGLLRYALALTSGRARTLEGRPLSPEAIVTIFGKGTTMERVLMAEGRVLDHGRKVRLFTGPMHDLLVVRDRGCRFPSAAGEPCDAPVEWVQGHHITFWEHLGVTAERNGAGACASHHGVIHREGWSFEVHPDGSMTVTRPDGATLTSPPPWAARPPTLPLHHPKLDEFLGPRTPTRPPGADPIEAQGRHASTDARPTPPDTRCHEVTPEPGEAGPLPPTVGRVDAAPAGDGEEVGAVGSTGAGWVDPAPAGDGSQDDRDRATTGPIDVEPPAADDEVVAWVAAEVAAPGSGEAVPANDAAGFDRQALRRRLDQLAALHRADMLVTHPDGSTTVIEVGLAA